MVITMSQLAQAEKLLFHKESRHSIPEKGFYYQEWLAWCHMRGMQNDNNGHHCPLIFIN